MQKLIQFIAAFCVGLMRPALVGWCAPAPGSEVSPDTTLTYNVAAGGQYIDSAGVGGAKTLPWTPGQVVASFDGAKMYRFVKMSVNAAVVGDMLAFSTAGDRFTVIRGTTNLPQAGLCITAIPIASYGWIQVYGLNEAAIATDTNVAIDNWCSLTTSQGIKPCTAGELITPGPCGQAIAADTGSAQGIGLFRLECPLN